MELNSAIIQTYNLEVNLLVKGAMLGPGDLTLKLPAILVLDVLDDHQELCPGSADHSPVARVEGGGDVVHCQQLRDGAGDVVTEPGYLRTLDERRPVVTDCVLIFRYSLKRELN